MKSKIFVAIILGCAIMLSGCTDARIAKLKTLGDNQQITCYSGGTVIYSGTSSGKVLSEQASDGYYFKDADTGVLMEVSGDCVIKG